jgi:FAD/FMN-containing dehydrogenase
LQKKIAGRVIPKGDAAYAKASVASVWNKRVAGIRSPGAIVQATSSQDVAEAVRFAKAHDLKIAIRGGGHNYHGAVLRDGSLLLDLGALRSMQIDAPNRRASVQPGITGGEFSVALASHGLAFPVGHCSDVCLSGYVLNGGLGWNYGEWGPASRSVRGMEMVTASGEILYADADRNSDLFWAARGAGPGFFAIVTRFDVVVYPMPKAIRFFAANFELESAPVIAEWFTVAIRSVHPTVEVICGLGPLDASGKPAITITAFSFAASQEEAVAWIAPLRKLPPGGKTIGDITDQPATHEDLLHMLDTGFPGNKRMAGDVRFTQVSAGELLLRVLPLARNAPPAPSSIELICLGGGKKLRLNESEGSVSMSGPTFVGAYGFWDGPAQDAASRTWVQSVMREVEPLSIGSYVGETDLSTSPDRASSCFSPEAWTKLVAIRKKYDPEQRFYSYLTEG